MDLPWETSQLQLESVGGMTLSFKFYLSMVFTRNFSRFALSLFVVFGTTLSVFPSVIVLITSQYRWCNHKVPPQIAQIRSEPDNVWASTYFTPVSCFLLFNCGDYVGRILAGWVRWPGKVRNYQMVELDSPELQNKCSPFLYVFHCRARGGKA